MVSLCTIHGQCPSEKYMLCSYAPKTAPSAKLYTRIELIMSEKSISDFHTCLYIPRIQNLEFNVPHAGIIGTHHCGNTCDT